MSIDDIADRIMNPVEWSDTKDVVLRAKLAANDHAQWSAKELKQVIADLLRVTGL